MATRIVKLYLGLLAIVALHNTDYVKALKPVNPVYPQKLVLVTVFCENVNRKNIVAHISKHAKKLRFSYDRQYRQTLTLIKSILINTDVSSSNVSANNPAEMARSRPVEIIIFTDNVDNFVALNKTVSSWGSAYMKNVQLSYQNAKYLKGYQWFENLFAPCNTLRLLLPQLLPSHDSVIYTDTDVVFLQGVSRLWDFFSKFSPKTKVAMARDLHRFNRREYVNRLKLRQVRAYNSGVMLMNLTRLRRSLSWNLWIKHGSKQNRNFLHFPNQDIMDVYFHRNPDQVQSLPCTWDFLPYYFNNPNKCSQRAGISILHGCQGAFFKEGKSQHVFELFESIQLENTPFNMTHFCTGWIGLNQVDLNRGLNHCLNRLV